MIGEHAARPCSVLPRTGLALQALFSAHRSDGSNPSRRSLVLRAREGNSRPTHVDTLPAHPHEHHGAVFFMAGLDHRRCNAHVGTRQLAAHPPWDI